MDTDPRLPAYDPMDAGRPPALVRTGPEPPWEGEAVEPEVNLGDYLRLVWSRRRLIGGIVAVVVLITVAWTLSQEEVFRARTTISVDSRVPLMAMPNAGLPVLEGERTVFKETPEQMAGKAMAMVEAGAQIIGGCCGTGPAHIAAMRRAIRER